MEYLRTCFLAKNMTLNAINAFQQGQKYQSCKNWQKYEEFDINILDFVDTSMYFESKRIKYTYHNREDCISNYIINGLLLNENS